MAEPRYTGDTFKQELSNYLHANASELQIYDIATINGKDYAALRSRLLSSNVMKIFCVDDKEIVLRERRDENTWFLREDSDKQARRLFEEVKKRKG